VSNIVKWCPVMAGSVFSCSMPPQLPLEPKSRLGDYCYPPET
jgi:hypothetical protein